MEHPHKRAIAEVRSNKSLYYIFFILESIYPEIQARALSFWVPFLQRLFAWISNFTSESIVIPKTLSDVLFSVWMWLMQTTCLVFSLSKRWHLSVFAFNEFFENQSNSLADESSKKFIVVWISLLAQYGVLSSK